jgi:DNA-binding GntR family transcriptional regulator
MILDPLVDALYTLIRTGELSPGERVDQRAISERLEVSRTPLREALRALASDGMVTRTPNAGYAVAKLSAVDLLQYYSIRTFLETEVLCSIEWPSARSLDELRSHNDSCREAAAAGRIESLMTANRAFHFTMFRWSPLTILIQEIERVWRVSDPYRALHLSNADRRARVSNDHDKMIEAIAARDAESLVQLMDDHRASSRRLLQGVLGSSSPHSGLSIYQSAGSTLTV